MEKYRLKIALTDVNTGEELAESSFTESGLKAVMHNSYVPELKSIMNEMIRQHEKGIFHEDWPTSKAVEWPRSRTITEKALLVIEDELKDRRSRGLSPFLSPPIEDNGILVTREDMQDYHVFTGLDPEESYKVLKSFFLREIDTIIPAAK